MQWARGCLSATTWQGRIDFACHRSVGARLGRENVENDLRDRAGAGLERRLPQLRSPEGAKVHSISGGRGPSASALSRSLEPGLGEAMATLF